MKKVIVIIGIAAFTLAGIASYKLIAGDNNIEGKCTPSGQGKCSSCSNCKYCKNCAKEGGSCSVCK